MRVLGIESTCDETGLALVEDGVCVLEEVLRSQVEDHAPWHGVVPELAARSHFEHIQTLYMSMISGTSNAYDAIAVSVRPGLLGSLLVGRTFAETLGVITGRPVCGVDHLEAHLYSVQMEHTVPYPYLGLLVSGGHTLIARCLSPTSYEYLGTTLDDSVGEAFDKVAKMLGMPYPGGPHIENQARDGDRTRFAFPRTALSAKDPQRATCFSFSGLKTAVYYLLKSHADADPGFIRDVCASFQEAALESLMTPLAHCVSQTGIRRVVICGGVAANSRLREILSQLDVDCYAPSPSRCSDQGIMIAGQGYHVLQRMLENREKDITVSPTSRIELAKP
ncbi:tRNA N6-adenosine threonylcarbamoyltransferase-like [Sycon ciliatum]|uniref:tRNA N6-adenosine threonylcarbamoyltransferase-like n=1 Tax=Sycon ciliatum TaxID=27933 RepID=UPI0031F6B0BF